MSDSPGLSAAASAMRWLRRIVLALLPAAALLGATLVAGCLHDAPPARSARPPMPAPVHPRAVTAPSSDATRCHALFDLTLLAVPRQSSRPVAQVPRGRELYLLQRQPDGYVLLQDPVTGLRGWTRLAEVEPALPHPVREKIPEADLPPDRP